MLTYTAVNQKHKFLIPVNEDGIVTYWTIYRDERYSPLLNRWWIAFGNAGQTSCGCSVEYQIIGEYSDKRFHYSIRR